MASAADILSAAKLKIAAHNRNLDCDKFDTLRYPDGTVVDLLPESGKKFTLKEYRDEILKDYQRIILYICVQGMECIFSFHT